MPTIHCMSGYIGFGKTTCAKELAEKYHAKRLTPDEIMIELYGTDVKSDFMEKAKHVNEYIWQKIEEYINAGEDIIYDTGPWGVADRKYIMNRASKLNATVIWHQMECPIETAKRRTLERAKENGELSITEKFFDENMKRYTPITKDEKLTVVYHKSDK